MKKILTWIRRLILVSIALVVSFVGYSLFRMYQATTPVESISKYESVLATWKQRGLVDHFPSRVPDSASEVRFSALEGFLQGGGHIQIRFKLPQARIESYYEDASSKAKQFQDGGDAVTLVNSSDDGLWSTNPHTLDKSYSKFTDDYRIFIYDAVPYQQDEEYKNWNHGASKGVVISLKRSEVIYYAEDW